MVNSDATYSYEQNTVYTVILTLPKYSLIDNAFTLAEIINDTPMLTRTILYYPTINIPSNSWLRHSFVKAPI
ncbi:UNVERIFIED_ORG: hypothetical protein DFS12_1208 [Chitinophaga ginsengisegetis]|nr:7,8-dihydro-6-hydroxymethylpterin-pyrophosphokinase [Chitinophaga ginsengisegetis]MDR6651086.1 7,8-dihydro-6-hydroxymethylpterin-pyrophosphokinase [Chitinophaga ginsengisegetis]MDR6657436.1 7,8-dihydro-6-hydroxymethylpterin-pyrophosphokinase [Chitinophaga ginsengisegetis]